MKKKNLVIILVLVIFTSIGLFAINTVNANDRKFDNDINVLDYYNKDKYTAKEYTETISDNEYAAEVNYSNFTGSKIIFDIKLQEGKEIGVDFSAINNNPFKVAFISEQNEVLTTWESDDWFTLSNPVIFPKGTTKVVLVGEHVTGGFKIHVFA